MASPRPLPQSVGSVPQALSTTGGSQPVRDLHQLALKTAGGLVPSSQGEASYSPTSASAPVSPAGHPNKWPVSKSGTPVRLFFDPNSERATALRRRLETELARTGRALTIVNSPRKATHICLDPIDGVSEWLNGGRPDQHVVTLAWLEDSHRRQASMDEHDYRLLRPDEPANEAKTAGEQMDVDPATEREFDDQAAREDSSRASPDDSTSSSDEDFALESDESGKSRDGSNYGSTAGVERAKKGVSWTMADRDELATLVSNRSGPVAEAIRSFQKRHPERSYKSIETEYYKRRNWYDSTNDRNQLREDEDVKPKVHQTHIKGEPTEETTIPEHQHSNAIEDARPVKGPNPFVRTSTKVSTDDHAQQGSGAEPESFRLPGVAPSKITNPQGLFCFVCGYGGSKKSFALIHSLVGTKTVGGNAVLASADPRWGCASCRTYFSQGVTRNEAYVWTRAMPGGLNELERLAWVTEKLLVRGMVQRRDVVEGRST